jgi:hypothetical protein
MLEEKNSNSGKLTGFEQLRLISLNIGLIYFIMFACIAIAIIGLFFVPICLTLLGKR